MGQRTAHGLKSDHEMSSLSAIRTLLVVDVCLWVFIAGGWTFHFSFSGLIRSSWFSASVHLGLGLCRTRSPPLGAVVFFVRLRTLSVPPV